MFAKNELFRSGFCRLTIIFLLLIQFSAVALARPLCDAVAQSPGYYTGLLNIGYGVGFLQIQTGVRARGMGEVSVALTDNPTGFIFNPAALVHTRNIAASGSYSNWIPEFLFDWNIYNFAASLTTEDLGSAGLSLQLITLGTIEYTDETGNSLGRSTPKVMVMTGGYAYPLTPNFAAGANLKLLIHDYDNVGAGLESADNSPSTIGFDFGFMVYDLLPHLTVTGDNLSFDDHPSGFARFAGDFGLPRHRGISLGLCLRNIGPNLKHTDYDKGDPLPHNFIMGFAYSVVDSDPIGFLIAGDLNRLILSELDELSDGMWINCGAELNLYRLFDLRGGCVHSAVDGSKYLTFGLGVGIDKFKFNYSYVPDGLDARWLAKTSFFELSANF